MNERSVVRMYQGAARTWLLLALFSLLLSPSVRSGVWLPLHLVLAGAVSVAICGAMAMFAQVLTAGPPHPAGATAAQFVLVNFGVGFATLGFMAHERSAVALGGVLFFASMVVLAWMVLRSRKRGLNTRHRVPLRMYLAAIACVMLGAVIGAVLGSGIVGDPALYAGLRRAHQTLNVLGWASFAIIGTLITLFPTVLKVRMVPWRGRYPAIALIAGVVVLAAGLALDAEAITLLGLGVYAVGSVSVTAMMVATLRSPRKHGVPISARHMVAANLWWLFGVGALLVAVIRDDLDAFRLPFLVAFVGGWIVQTLAGAWLYLLPVWRPGSPEARARWVRAAEFGGWTQLAVCNLGLALLAAGTIAPGLDPLVMRTGALLCLTGLAVILGKAFLFPAFDRRRSPPHVDSA